VSAHDLRLIPTDPPFVPDYEAAFQARERLASFLPRADEVTARVDDEIAFVDAGANTGEIHSPACAAEVPWDWFIERMDAAWPSRFSDLSTVTPCCRARCSLNDLEFTAPAGFARFKLEALDPDVVDLTGEQLSELERLLGTPLRRIWSRY